MRIGIYNRYWSTRGGGERYSATLAAALASDHSVSLIGVEPIEPQELSEHLGIDLSGVDYQLWPATLESELSPLTADYDLFVNCTFGSSLPSQAERSAYVVYFPQRLRRGDGAFLDTYDPLISISEYTRTWIAKRWRRPCVVLQPPVDTETFAAPEPSAKRRLILSVGRFFYGAHNKKHLEFLEVFRRMCDRGHVPEGWEYHLVGNLHRNRLRDLEYYADLERLAEGYPVRLLTDLPLSGLQEEYRQASIFWHGAGWGESTWRRPENHEHFGITTCEAMAAGCVPVVIARAGQLEIVRDGESGFFFKNGRELVAISRRLVEGFGQPWVRTLSRQAVQAAEAFGVPAFERRLLEILGKRGLLS